jgi:hypothetical protein
VDSAQKGEAPFASHLFYTQLLPETSESRELGLKMRDRIAFATNGLVARYIDIGYTTGMFRDCDCTAQVQSRHLEGAIRQAWLDGEWPEASARLAVA